MNVFKTAGLVKVLQDKHIGGSCLQTYRHTHSHICFARCWLTQEHLWSQAAGKNLPVAGGAGFGNPSVRLMSTGNYCEGSREEVRKGCCWSAEKQAEDAQICRQQGGAEVTALETVWMEEWERSSAGGDAPLVNTELSWGSHSQHMLPY